MLPEKKGLLLLNLFRQNLRSYRLSEVSYISLRDTRHALVCAKLVGERASKESRVVPVILSIRVRSRTRNVECLTKSF